MPVRYLLFDGNAITYGIPFLTSGNDGGEKGRRDQRMAAYREGNDEYHAEGIQPRTKGKIPHFGHGTGEQSHMSEYLLSSLTMRQLIEHLKCFAMLIISIHLYSPNVLKMSFSTVLITCSRLIKRGDIKILEQKGETTSL